jgi:hypothetical protein
MPVSHKNKKNFSKKRKNSKRTNKTLKHMKGGGQMAMISISKGEGEVKKLEAEKEYATEFTKFLNNEKSDSNLTFRKIQLPDLYIVKNKNAISSEGPTFISDSIFLDTILHYKKSSIVKMLTYLYPGDSEIFSILESISNLKSNLNNNTKNPNNYNSSENLAL